jgi:hypothetical protein
MRHHIFTSDSAIYDYRDPTCLAYPRAIKVMTGRGDAYLLVLFLDEPDGAVVGDAGTGRGGRRFADEAGQDSGGAGS